MPVQVRFITDPACVASWSAEPVVRKLQAQFGDGLDWRPVMGGLARDYAAGELSEDVRRYGERRLQGALVAHWLDAADRGRMPLDPRLWLEAPISSSYPACMAVKAAAEQGGPAAMRYLRAVREGLLCFRRKLDTREALVEEARGAGLDVERFRVDLGSHAIVEAFGADLEEARAVPDEARAAGAVTTDARGQERIAFPAVVFVGEDGERQPVYAQRDYAAYRSAALAAGASPSLDPTPGVLDALRDLGRMATAEVEAVCELPTPRAAAELWRLAAEWQVRPVRVLTGYLWEAA